MNPMLNMAIKAAQTAGDIIARSADRIDQLQVENKDKNDFVTEIDRLAEATIIDLLKKSYPSHTFVGEESDGTTNFIYGIPHYAVSIALKRNGKLDQAVIYDPIKDDLFYASRGGGAFLNNRRIRVSKRLSMQDALLTTGVPYRPDQSSLIDSYFESLKALLPDTAGVRRPGSASLDLAYVAAGRYDGFWEFSLHEWDIAAGVLLVQEAGGLVGDLEGGSSHMKTGNILAANPKVFKEMVKRLHPIVKNIS
ncbi:Inositol-1-monophosphatase [Nymphon striatum]|nr:Inositol-1-monophosphatase [Nymphon striatum]